MCCINIQTLWKDPIMNPMIDELVLINCFIIFLILLDGIFKIRSAKSDYFWIRLNFYFCFQLTKRRSSLFFHRPLTPRIHRIQEVRWIFFKANPLPTCTRHHWGSPMLPSLTIFAFLSPPLGQNFEKESPENKKPL